MSIFERRESSVRSYCRTFSTMFTRAEGAKLFASSGRAYIDFLAGAGSLNYGHNPPLLRDALIEYIAADGIALGLDLYTEAKAAFLETFERIILVPRGYDYVLQFTGPTGTNAVEAALKLARKFTGRQNIIAFTNGFHGMTLGALAATGNSANRAGAGVPLTGVTRMPYDGYMGGNTNASELLESMLADPSSGLDLPAAMIVECVQGEGGLRTASSSWLRALERICNRYEILLIVDDIQAGCGRTGTFFSFEDSGIRPDMVLLSKSLSGFGLPLSTVLIDPKLDIWNPGEHNGTFRGNNHAFVTATTALKSYWTDDQLSRSTQVRASNVSEMFEHLLERYPEICLARRGRGMMQGLVMVGGDVSARVIDICFERGLVIESSGANGEVLKCLAPLTISEEDLGTGLDILASAVAEI